MTRRIGPLAALPLALLGLCAVLLIALGRAPEPWAPAAGAGATPPAPDVADPAQAGTAGDMPHEAAFDIVVARNLFAVDRAPPADEFVADSAGGRPAAGSSELELTGIVRGADRSTAILRDTRDSKMVRLRSGDRYRGWVLARVDAMGVTLQRRDEDVRLDLKFAPEPERPRDPTVRVTEPDRVRIQQRRGDGSGNPVPATRQREVEDPGR